MTPINTEVIRALTPTFLATISGVIGIAVLIKRTQRS